MELLDLLNKMVDEGLNAQDFKEREHMYRYCSKCFTDFDSQLKPVLLKCGHVCCSQCTDDLCGICAMPVEVVNQSFDFLLEYFHQTDKEARDDEEQAKEKEQPSDVFINKAIEFKDKISDFLQDYEMKMQYQSGNIPDLAFPHSLEQYLKSKSSFMTQKAQELGFDSLWPDSEENIQQMIRKVRERFEKKKNFEQIMVIHQLMGLLGQNQSMLSELTSTIDTEKRSLEEEWELKLLDLKHQLSRALAKEKKNEEKIKQMTISQDENNCKLNSALHFLHFTTKLVSTLDKTVIDNLSESDQTSYSSLQQFMMDIDEEHSSNQILSDILAAANEMGESSDTFRQSYIQEIQSIKNIRKKHKENQAVIHYLKEIIEELSPPLL